MLNYKQFKDNGIVLKEVIKNNNSYTISDGKRKYLVKNNADFSRYRVSHNFYPKPYTGLSFERVKEKNEMLKKYGFTVMMWIPTLKNRRPPLYKGLPTIEEQRNSNIYYLTTHRKWLRLMVMNLQSLTMV